MLITLHFAEYCLIFLRSDNHLNVACEMGLGTNRLDEIEVVGHSIADVRIEFATSGH